MEENEQKEPPEPRWENPIFTIWDGLYKDVLEDGVNGNEEFYDSPSGWFDALPVG